MERVEPTMQNALAPAWNVRLGAVEAAWNDWARQPTRKNRTWARLLARAAATDVSSAVRNEAIEALSEIGTLADRRVLVAALDDEWDVVRASAVSALAQVVGRRAEVSILRATKDRSTLVRRYAWVALYDAVGEASRDRLEEAARLELDVEAAVGIWAGLFALGHPDARSRVEEFAASGNPRINSWAQDTLAEER